MLLWLPSAGLIIAQKASDVGNMHKAMISGDANHWAHYFLA